MGTPESESVESGAKDDDLPNHICVVEAKDAVRVVHQHVEMPQKSPPIIPRRWRSAVRRGLTSSTTTGWFAIECEPASSKSRYANEACVLKPTPSTPIKPWVFKVKFGCQQSIHYREAGTVIHQKFVGAGNG